MASPPSTTRAATAPASGWCGSADASPALRAAAEPHLRALAEDVRATAHLTVADGDDGVAVAVVEPSSTAFHVAYRTGSRHPDRGAAGKAILGGRRPPAQRRRWYVTTGELQEGAVGLAAPLGHGQIEASVGVVTLGRIDERRIGRPSWPRPPRYGPTCPAHRPPARRTSSRPEGVGPAARARLPCAAGVIMSRRTVGVVLAVVGAVGIAGSFAWREAVEPRLVKFPTDLDETRSTPARSRSTWTR